MITMTIRQSMSSILYATYLKTKKEKLPSLIPILNSSLYDRVCNIKSNYLITLENVNNIITSINNFEIRNAHKHHI